MRDSVWCGSRLLVAALILGLQACGGGPGPGTDAGLDASAGGSGQAVDGRAAYDALCVSCHRDGTGGAPATGDRSAWAERSPLWMAVLAEHAKNGYLQMPARGGDAELTDADVEAAAEYMMSLTYPDRPPSL